jgi:hypothetical protein
MSEPKKRGRPPKPVAERRRHNQTFRCNDEMLARLQEEADRNQRSISEEVERRLDKSLENEKISEAIEAIYMRNLHMIFGGEEGFKEVINIGIYWNRAKERYERRFGSEKKWFESEEGFRFVEDYFKSSVRLVLRGIAMEAKRNLQK